MTMRRTLLALLIGLAVTVFAATPSQGETGLRLGTLERCGFTTATGATVFDPTVGAFVGSADVTIGGRHETVPVQTVLLGQEVGTDGVIRAKTSHRFHFASGTIVTLDRAILTPTETPGVYTLRTSARVVSGGFGFLVIRGEIDLRGLPKAQWRATGFVCQFPA